MISLPNTIRNLYYIGDLHGNLNYLRYITKTNDLINSCIICLGDIGIGFSPKEDQQVISYLNKFFKLKNVYIIALYGNHDDNTYFTDSALQENQYIYLIPSYTVINVLNKNILCIGGAISIDRCVRKKNDSINIVNYMKYHNCDYKTAELRSPKTYWENENVVYQPKVESKIDIICSHTAPSFCYPATKGSIVLQFAEQDKNLISDIKEEREILDKVYNNYKDDITHWYYGHFHKNHTEVISGIMFKLLDVCNICRHVTEDGWDHNDLL